MIAVLGLAFALAGFWALERRYGTASFAKIDAAGLPWTVHSETVGPSDYGLLREVRLSLRDDARLPDGQLMDLAVTLCEALTPPGSGEIAEVFRLTLLLPATGGGLFAPDWVEGPTFAMAVREETCSHELR